MQAAGIHGRPVASHSRIGVSPSQDGPIFFNPKVSHVSVVSPLFNPMPCPKKQQHQSPNSHAAWKSRFDPHQRGKDISPAPATRISPPHPLRLLPSGAKAPNKPPWAALVFLLEPPMFGCLRFSYLSSLK